ncbi:MAG: protein-glutamate O-methyltransferase [Rhizobiales bacterium]|nr:protein-glutamate O-methyltransferase [Hyphomicrobiales bacterium]
MENGMPNVTSEFNLSLEQFHEIAQVVERMTGINLPERKHALVYSRLARRVRALGMKSFADYTAFVNGTEGKDELFKMAEALTTNVTKFFREDHHFEHFKTHLMPRLISKAKAGEKVRIWSAGCSSGQEPYSIALCILASLPDARSYDIKILATDINTQVLATGRRGVYALEDLASIPANLRNSWTEASGNQFEFDEAAKRLISFKQLNLIEPWPMKGLFNAIFCRNVMIYFSPELQSTLWERFASKLDDEGMIYIGHSERVIGPATGKLNIEGPTAYRKKLRAVA